MKNWAYSAVLMVGLVGCGARPEPTGPAAEAPIDDIEITVDGPTGSTPEVAESTTLSPDTELK